MSKNGVPLAQFRSQKEAALLIYLAQTKQSHQRDFLTELLWESSSTKQSLTNLRTALSRLRKRVGDALLVTRKTVELTPENQQQVDSVILLQTLAEVGKIDTASGWLSWPASTPTMRIWLKRLPLKLLSFWICT